MGSFLSAWTPSDWTSGYKPFIRVAFSDGVNITAEQGLQGSEHITEFEGGEAPCRGVIWMVNKVLVPDAWWWKVPPSAYAWGPWAWVLGYVRVGGGVRKLFVDPIIDHFLSPGGMLRQANSPLATGDSALTNSQLVFTVDSASVLHVETWGRRLPASPTTPGRACCSPAVRRAISPPTPPAIPPPPACPAGLGLPFELTTNLSQGTVLTTQTPTVSLYYTSTNTILPGSLQGRLNGRLFTNGLLPGVSQTTYAVAPQNLLNQGSNRLRAAVQINTGDRRTLDLTFSASAAPETPFGLRAIAATGKVLLGWQPNQEGDLAGYRVYTSTTETSPSQLITHHLAHPAGLPGYAPRRRPPLVPGRAGDAAGNASSQTAAVLAAPPLLPGTAAAPVSFAAAPGDGKVVISFVDEDPSALGLAAGACSRVCR